MKLNWIDETLNHEENIEQYSKFIKGFIEGRLSDIAAAHFIGVIQGLQCPSYIRKYFKGFRTKEKTALEVISRYVALCNKLYLKGAERAQNGS